jgi:hypothetical protein
MWRENLIVGGEGLLSQANEVVVIQKRSLLAFAGGKWKN